MSRIVYVQQKHLPKHICISESSDHTYRSISLAPRSIILGVEAGIDWNVLQASNPKDPKLMVNLTDM